MSPVRKPDQDPTEAALSAIQEALLGVSSNRASAPTASYNHPAYADASAYLIAPKFESAPSRDVEAELNVETVSRIQADADNLLSEEEWVQIDGLIANK
jgi:hypothetical protein